MNNLYDTIIIGAGPAGLTAGIYTTRREMKTLLISRDIGGQVVWASSIENYPGYKQIDNFELIQKWQEQATSLGVEVKTLEVQKIEKDNDQFRVYAGNDIFYAQTIIIAMGLLPRRLAIPGEKELTAKGISYCANCDSPLYRDKTVAVIGGGNSALDAAELLSKIAKRVYLIHRRHEFRGFDALVNQIEQKTNIKKILNSEVKEIKGDTKVESIIVNEINNNQSQEIKVNGVFIEIGRIAHTDLVKDFVERNDKDQIIIDEKCRTKTTGVFAAGDATTSPYKQITVAMGQGTIAALASYEYLQLKQGKDIKVVSDRSIHKQ